MMRRSSLLCFAREDPERGITLDGNRRDPSERANLLCDVQRRVASGRFFGQEENDFGRSLAAACSTIVFFRDTEIGELRARDAMALIDKGTLQRLCEDEIAADQGDHARRGAIGEWGLQTSRRATPEHGARPGRRGGPH
jgi:hypothetical protein